MSEFNPFPQERAMPAGAQAVRRAHLLAEIDAMESTNRNRPVILRRVLYTATAIAASVFVITAAINQPWESNPTNNNVEFTDGSALLASVKQAVTDATGYVYARSTVSLIGEGTQSSSESWSQLVENGSSRTKYYDENGSLSSDIGNYVSADGRSIGRNVNYETRTVTEYTGSVDPERKGSDPVRLTANDLTADKILGRETIKGINTVHLVDPDLPSARELWIDPATRLPVRSRITIEAFNVDISRADTDYQWLTDLDESAESVFLPPIPPGFAITSEKT